ncbi:serine/threonine-protein kinase [Streptomyces sp. NBC_01808]|uniref:serine/threonine-protein kinase n=1 Tax=Streptomyces sp. NBC_01808 TaxID=2975947 RepID=UPI002DD940E2|nr:serine/threonine-protein kinase [Streptomyces sp. NBC_01808]WSA37735.1 serine/threonine-protein kinase [Streptomyces sp. NBC_01808]
MGESEAGAGRRLAGRYRVVGQLGRGGMGTVWRAVDEVLGREVAVKELRAFGEGAGHDAGELRLRMQREARAAARVDHPGVIAVHDVTEHEGRPLIVMELVEGPSLDDVIRERGVLDPAEAAGIGAKVVDALAAAHRAGVLHRDVKPANILLARSGRVVLTDFGIAAMDDPGDDGTTRLTAPGEMVGSIDYLSPERARGDLPGPPSDVWSLGVTLYAAVEGMSPFRRSSTWSTISAIVVDPLPEPQRAGALTGALRELMDKDPDRRADALRAGRLLAAVAAGQPLPDPAETMRLGGPIAASGGGTGPGVGTGAGTGAGAGGFGPAPESQTPSMPPEALNPSAGFAGAAPYGRGGQPQGQATPYGQTPPGSAETSPGHRPSRRRRPLVLAGAAVAVAAVTAAAFTVPGWVGSDDGDDANAAGADRSSSAPAEDGAQRGKMQPSEEKEDGKESASPSPSPSAAGTSQPTETPGKTTDPTPKPSRPDATSAKPTNGPTTSAPPADPWDSCTYYSGTALTQNGDSGERVVQLQCILHARGYDLGSDGVDGVFGPKTEAAVKKFQGDEGLAVDGQVGPDTWGALRG